MQEYEIITPFEDAITFFARSDDESFELADEIMCQHMRDRSDYQNAALVPYLVQDKGADRTSHDYEYIFFLIASNIGGNTVTQEAEDIFGWMAEVKRNPQASHRWPTH